MAEMEDRTVDPTPVAVSSVPVRGTFKFEGNDWFKTSGTDSQYNPQCACLSNGELRAVVASTLVVETALFFDEV